MYSFTTLSIWLSLAIAVSSSPVVVRNNFVTLPFAKSVNVTGPLDLVRKDQARAKGLRSLAKSRLNGEALDPDAVVNVGVTNQATTYTANVGVGSPATTYSLLIDTGSSNTWVGAGKAYVRTSTSTQTSNRVVSPLSLLSM
ncbi:hypothetical protein OF83DRAFT_2943 [Amylostereum chailletii]|nr:hypothetical protein OF83DRAFT_2943 [Amylostereum chailletii]